MDRLPLSRTHDKKTARANTTATEQAIVSRKAEHAATPVLFDSASTPDPDNWKYTSLLWEKAQLEGLVPHVTDNHISTYPAKFRVIIELKGIQGSGEARNKKSAKHLAAKSVCHHLGLHVFSE